MTTVGQLKHDLDNLLSECRRKHSDIRTAVESALNEIKLVPPLQPIKDNEQLQHRLCIPFMMAVGAGSKLMAQGLSVLQRLIATKSLPENFAAELLQSFYKNDANSLPLDCQLKILQTIPALMQNYKIHGQNFLLLVAILCLLMNSGSSALSNTASATIQQVFSSLFDKLKEHKKGEDTTMVELSTPDSEKPSTFHLDALELECYKVFTDLSAIVSNDEREYFDPDIQIRRVAVLEIIENILSLNKQVFRTQEELISVCRVKTFPALLKVINSPTLHFPNVVRALRIVHLLIATQPDLLGVETEIVLSSTNHLLLDTEDTSSRSLSITNFSGETPSSQASTASQYWMKVLVLEMYKALFSDFEVLRALFVTHDTNEKGKNVVSEIFTVLNHFLETSLPQYFSEERGLPSSDNPTLSKQNAALKLPLLDHLDKSEPPASISRLYSAHLVLKVLTNVVDGVSEFVSSLSANSGSSSIETDVDFVTGFNETVFPEIFKLFQKFIHCSMDNDYFHSVVRALQRYTHAVGLLGLTEPRNKLLLLLSECVIKGPVKSEDSKQPNSNLYTLGESIVETLSSTIQAPASPHKRKDSLTETNPSKNGTTEDVLQNASRVFTSRQIICYRALTNLAISLGLTLQDSWRIIWVTFQWVDYFITGPDEHSGSASNKDLRKVPEPLINSQDTATIKTSRSKLLESISEYQAPAFEQMVSVLTLLYTKGPLPSDEIPICPYNRAYFVRQLLMIVTSYPSLLLDNKKVWDHITVSFASLATDRSIPQHTRNLYITSMNDVVVSVTKKGFQESDDTDSLAAMSLEAFIVFINKLFSLPKSEELLVSNCETEMHLTVLTTLRSLIDEFDDRFKNSWGLVFTLLGSVFHQYSSGDLQDNKLDEKKRLLISTSFDILKLILDEFLTTLPEEQLKTLIDTLMSFCSQEQDLNISFSAVSYFWSISDSIRSHMDNVSNSTDNLLEGVDNIKALESALDDCSKDSVAFYQGLNVYLLSRLSYLSADSRTHVREGAIQTLFQILDTHGKYLPSWKLVYDVVLPGVIDVSRWSNKVGSQQNDVLSAFNLVLSGVVAVLNKYMLNFEDAKTTDLKIKFWEKILKYFNDLLALNWKDLNLKIFESYQDLIMPLPKATNVPDKIINIVFDFWTNVPIEYDFVKPEYQDSLAVFNKSFLYLYPIAQPRLSLLDVSKVLSLLNQCARYPVLKASLNDAEKLTDVQKAVMQNLDIISKQEMRDEFNSVIIQHLCIILCYPYQTRTRIERKLKSKFEGRLKIPTFAAISEASLELMTSKIHGLKDLKVLLPEQGFEKVISSLIEAVSYKAQSRRSDSEKPQWVKCNDLILYLTERILAENLEDIKERSEVWHLLVDAVTVNFEDVKPKEEKESLAQYGDLSKKILPVLSQGSVKQDTALQQIIGRIYRQSFVYDMNGIEKELCAGNLENTISSLSSFSFEDCFGTTATLVPYPNRDLRLQCLADLFSFALGSDRSLGLAYRFALARASFCLRRVIAEQRLLNRKPMGKILEEELEVVLEGLKEVLQVRKDKFEGITTLLSKLAPFALKIDGSGKRIETILLKLHSSRV